MANDWWHGAAIYQIYPRSFCDSNGDGVGDLPGITSKLGHVASLGVDAIWLSPFFVSPMADFGYDVADYHDVDPLFGTLRDFDDLVAEAHRLGLKVIIDMVWAHTSDRHSWFKRSRAARDGEFANWYQWADARIDGTPPNNWLSVFGGGAWTWEPRRKQYYLHHFLPGQPKLNLREPAVMEALLEIAGFWMDRGADGFRLDAVDFFVHDPALRNNPPMLNGKAPTKPYHMQQHFYDLGGSSVVPVIEQLRAYTDRNPGFALIAEVGSETTDTTSMARAGTYTGLDRPGVHAAYSLSQMKSRGDAAAIRAAIREAETAFPHGNLVWAFSNHDVPRVVSRWGDGSAAAARMFMTLLLTLRGSIFIYQGEELGLPDAEVPYERMQDPYGRNYWPEFKGRDGSRTPMPWKRGERNAGFSPADETWLPIPPDHRALAVDVQERDPDSLLNAWRRLLKRRRDEPALRAGTLTLLDTPDPVIAFRRQSGNRRFLCAFNISREPVDAPLDAKAMTPLEDFACHIVDGVMRMEAYGAFIGQQQ